MRKILFILWCFSVILSSCNSKEGKHGETKAVKVKAVVVHNQTKVGNGSYSATVEKDASVAVSFAVLGTVKSLHVRDGQHISKGTLVATLNDERTA